MIAPPLEVLSSFLDTVSGPKTFSVNITRDATNNAEIHNTQKLSSKVKVFYFALSDINNIIITLLTAS